jgi:hypothetical protein
MGDPLAQVRSGGLFGRLGDAVKALFAPASFEPDELLPPVVRPLPPRHQEALAVLDAARVVIARGWLQDAWYALQGPDGQRRMLTPTRLVRLDHSQVVGACLVGAVLHGAWQHSPRSEQASPAIDALWQTLYGGGDGGPIGPVSSPPVRAARVRDLTRWNDERHRTRDEVLGLLDRTAARVAASAAA